MQQVRTLLIFSFFSILLMGCQSEAEVTTKSAYSPQEMNTLSASLNLPEEPFSYGFGNFDAGELVDHKASLGRVLFYDKNLSADRSVSCASCHQQSLAFADDKILSQGANGNTTSRNSIALSSFRSFGQHYDKTLNAGTNIPGLFWDERAEDVEDQLRQTINNPNEMGMELQDIVDIINSTDYYSILHEKAYGNAEVSEQHILESIEAFVNSIGSNSSKFETSVLENLNFITGDMVTGEMNNELGFELFVTNCNSCHNTSFNLVENAEELERFSVANNGLTLADNDQGVYEYTQNEEDRGKFKIPGLLNIELTAPYMHDGRFASLEEVVEHYNSGIEYSESLHPALKDGNQAKRLNLSEEEKTALVDFLKLLTDDEVKTNIKWSNPFK